VYDELKRLWQGGVMYHCGPVVSQDEAGRWHFVSAGPTTSTREEPYEADVIAHFGLRAVIGKGGMGPKTLAACKEHGAVYLHAIGGAATLIASYVKEVVAVFKKDDLGVPEAFWVVRVEGFPVVVTMDAHGESLHERMYEESKQKLAELL
jgi:fumarate hydratase class I